MSCTLAASQGYSQIGHLRLVCELGLQVRACREDFKSQCQSNLVHSGSSIWEPASPSPTLGRASGRHSSGHAWGARSLRSNYVMPGAIFTGWFQFQVFTSASVASLVSGSVLPSWFWVSSPSGVFSSAVLGQ